MNIRFIARAASIFICNDGEAKFIYLRAYEKLIKEQSEGNGDVLAHEFVSMFEEFQNSTVDEVIKHINTYANNLPEFILNIDWEKFQRNKNFLIETGIENEPIDEILELMNSIQDYASDILKMKNVFAKDEVEG